MMGGSMSDEKIRIGISSCLLGEKVRFDGQHKLDHFIVNTLGEYFDFVPVCPEVELGLPTPRPALRLVGTPNAQRLVFGKTGEDISAAMERWCQRRVAELEKEQLCGFIFKKGSPSSGMERVKLYDQNGIPQGKGVGFFARAFMAHFPLLPVEEEGRLNDPKLRENFITRVFTLQRLRQALGAKNSFGAVVDFHTRHKYLIFSHSQKHYREMGRLVAQGKALPFATFLAHYNELLQAALHLRTTVSKQANVLQHLLGYFKHELSSDEKQEALGLIEDYRNDLVPLIVPITLINHFVRKYNQPYLKQQIYLNPHPRELKLLNHV